MWNLLREIARLWRITMWVLNWTVWIVEYSSTCIEGCRTPLVHWLRAPASLLEDFDVPYQLSLAAWGCALVLGFFSLGLSTILIFTSPGPYVLSTDHETETRSFSSSFHVYISRIAVDIRPCLSGPWVGAVLLFSDTGLLIRGPWLGPDFTFAVIRSQQSNLAQCL